VAEYSPKFSVELVGKRVMIRAIKNEGSGRLLNGLKATVTALHPIARDWCKIELDQNNVTEQLEWSIAIDRLVFLSEDEPGE
jgi:hypothetical protein